MESRTREGCERAWSVIGPRFGRSLITRISAEESERFHVDLHPRHKNARDPKGEMKLSWHKAHLVLKHWRLLLSALVDYALIAPAPVGRISNPTPPPRSHVWTAPEIYEGLVPAAQDMRRPGMALAIAIGWETMMSTVDVRLLKIGDWKPGHTTQIDGKEVKHPGEFATRRKKSKKAVFVSSSLEFDAMIEEWLALLRAAGDPIDPGAPADTVGDVEALLRSPRLPRRLRRRARAPSRATIASSATCAAAPPPRPSWGMWTTATWGPRWRTGSTRTKRSRRPTS